MLIVIAAVACKQTGLLIDRVAGPVRSGLRQAGRQLALSAEYYFQPSAHSDTSVWRGCQPIFYWRKLDREGDGGTARARSAYLLDADRRCTRRNHLSVLKTSV